MWLDVTKFDRLVQAARGIMPPDKDDDPEHVRCWRVNVFWSLLIIMVVLGFHLSATSGMLEPLGISGVANASEVQQNGKTARAILRRMALPEIRAKVRERCHADTAPKRESINRDLDRILEQFKTDTGEDFGDLPTCAEV